MKPADILFTAFILGAVGSLFIFMKSHEGTCYVNNQPVQVRNVDNCL